MKRHFSVVKQALAYVAKEYGKTIETEHYLFGKQATEVAASLFVDATPHIQTIAMLAAIVKSMKPSTAQRLRDELFRREKASQLEANYQSQLKKMEERHGKIPACVKARFESNFSVIRQKLSRWSEDEDLWDVINLLQDDVWFWNRLLAIPSPRSKRRTKTYLAYQAWRRRKAKKGA